MSKGALGYEYYTRAQQFYDLAEQKDNSDRFLDHLFEKAIVALNPAPYWLFSYFLDRKAMLHGGTYWPESPYFLTYLQYLHQYGNGDLSYIPKEVMAEVLLDILWKYIPISVICGANGKKIRAVNFKKIQSLLVHRCSDFWDFDTDNEHSSSLGELEKVCTRDSLFLSYCEEEREIAMVTDMAIEILQEYEDYMANPTLYCNRFSALIEFLFGTSALDLPVLLSVEIGEWLYAANEEFVAPSTRPRAWEIAQFVKRALRLCSDSGHQTIAVRARANRQSDLRNKRVQRRARMGH